MKTIEAAQGKWIGILSNFGIDQNYLVNKGGPCPLCGGRDRYRFDDQNGSGSYFCSSCGAGYGIDLAMKWTGRDFKSVAKEIDRIIHNVERVEPKPKTDPLVRLRKIQGEIRPIDGINPVSLYLRSRGLPANKNLKLHQNIPYYDDGKFVGTFAAMVARVDAVDGSPVTYHITHLTSGGDKAPVDAVKKILPPAQKMNGAAIRLAPHGPVLAVAEGIETSLAVMRDYKIPCWALINNLNLESFEPPERTKIIIFGDNDNSFAGQKSAYILANKLKLKGVDVEVRIPEKVGTDFADEVMA